MSTKRWASVGLAAIVVVAAGCSNDSAETGSTNAGGSNQNDSARGQAVKFSRCMRDNGVAAFPDPDASGELTIDGVLNGSSIDSDSAGWQQAIDTCKDLQPSGFTGHKATSREQEGRLRFAQCIRDNGVADFPDPTADGPMIDTNRIPSAATDGGMSALHAAMQKCRDAASDAGVEGP